MGTKVTETSGQTATGPVTADENALRDLLASIARGASGSIGGIDDTDFSQGISPEMQELVERTFEKQAEGERIAINRDYTKAVDDTSNYLASRGVTDSSQEATAINTVGLRRADALAGVEARKGAGVAGAELKLPFDIASADTSRMNSLSQLLNISSNPLLSNFLQTRMGNVSSSGTQSTSGFTLGELLNPAAQIYGASQTA